MAAKNDPVDKQANVTDILDTFMASKKVSQCVAITRPENKKANKLRNYEPPEWRLYLSINNAVEIKRSAAGDGDIRAIGNRISGRHHGDAGTVVVQVRDLPAVRPD